MRTTPASSATSRWGFLQPDGGINATSKTGHHVISDQQKNKDQEWKAPVRYIGVDVQYFAALVVPVEDQLKDPTIERSIPMVLDRPAEPIADRYQRPARFQTGRRWRRNRR